MTDLQRWDKLTAPTLRAIEELAEQVASRSRQVGTALRDLPAKPAFITKAEAALETAERELATALRLIRQARTIYNALPVEGAQLVAAE